MTQASPATPPASTAPPQAGPRTLAHRYELLWPLGYGTSGTTHLARDLHLGRLVAVKILDRPDPAALDRLRREARIAARLRHPTIVVLHELHAESDPPFLVTQYVDGGPLTHGGIGLSRDLTGHSGETLSLRKNRRSRYPSAAELVRDLDRVLARGTDRPRLPVWITRLVQWLARTAHHMTTKERNLS